MANQVKKNTQMLNKNKNHNTKKVYECIHSYMHISYYANILLATHVN